MSSVNVFVGLDYSQEFVQMCVMDETGNVLANRAVANCGQALRQAAERYGVVKAAALEACCGSANLADELTALGWSVSLAHPGYVARMKQTIDKTDFADARVLADLLRVGYLPKVWLAPERLRELRRLTRFRQQRVNKRRDTKLRIRALLRENRLRSPGYVRCLWTKNGLAWLRDVKLSDADRWLMNEHLEDLTRESQKIKEVEQRLAQLAEDDALVQQLLQLEQIGLVTAMTIRAEVGTFDRFQTGKQLARFCGVTPRNVSSGTRQADAGLIRAGNPQLRCVLIELAQRLVHHRSQHWEPLIRRLRKKGKKTNVIVAAVANRYMRRLFHQMQPQQLAV